MENKFKIRFRVDLSSTFPAEPDSSGAKQKLLGTNRNYTQEHLDAAVAVNMPILLIILK